MKKNYTHWTFIFLIIIVLPSCHEIIDVEKGERLVHDFPNDLEVIKSIYEKTNGKVWAKGRDGWPQDSSEWPDKNESWEPFLWDGIKTTENGRIKELVINWTSHLEMVGEFPFEEILKLDSLEKFVLEMNRDDSISENLRGKLPENINTLKNLKYLGITGVFLVGKIPSTISDLQNLETLRIGEYKQHIPIAGSLPDFSKLKQLKSIRILGTQISGSLPKSLLGLNNLENIVIHNPEEGKIKGSIPEGIETLTKLHTFRLSLDYDEDDGIGTPLPDMRKLEKLKNVYLWGVGLILDSIPAYLLKFEEMGELTFSPNYGKMYENPEVPKKMLCSDTTISNSLYKVRIYSKKGGSLWEKNTCDPN